jgi:hypothetical protein
MIELYWSKILKFFILEGIHCPGFLPYLEMKDSDDIHTLEIKSVICHFTQAAEEFLLVTWLFI